MNDETLIWLEFDEPEQANRFVKNARSSTDPLAQNIKTLNFVDDNSAGLYIIPSVLAPSLCYLLSSSKDDKQTTIKKATIN